MSEPWAEGAAPVEASANTLQGDWYGDLGRMPLVAKYAASLVLVALAAILAFVVAHLIAAPNLALIFVLPVVIAAVSFGWGPSLAAAVASVVAFDFFFTEPTLSLAIASPADMWAATLLLVTAAIVSTVAAQARRAALEARRAAEQAEALRALAHMVIEARPQPEVTRAAATALGQIFRAPAAIFMVRDGSLELVATARNPQITSAEEEAARGAVDSHGPVRADTYPYDQSAFDFWAVGMPTGGRYVLGLDFTKSQDGRPDAPERFVDTVGAYLVRGA